MNVAIAKADDTVADESEENRMHSTPANEPAKPQELIEEPSLDEGTNRRLYRRSVAYFFFGFGCNQHSIVTDEPSG